jgi:hypothetical protein
MVGSIIQMVGVILIIVIGFGGVHGVTLITTMLDGVTLLHVVMTYPLVVFKVTTQ